MNITKNNDLIKKIQMNEKQIKLMKLLSTKEGFFEYYFIFLKNFKTKEDAFFKVNELYLNYFGETRFNSFIEFRSNLRASYKL